LKRRRCPPLAEVTNHSWSRMMERETWLPTYDTVRSCGHHLRSSFSQLPRVESGTTTRKGPDTLCTACRYARKELDCTVLPRPISSARMPFLSRHQLEAIQLSPMSW
jgi:hypothetical protein